MLVGVEKSIFQKQWCLQVALYDLFLQDVILYDFMWLVIKMSPYTTVVSSSSAARRLN